MAKLSLKGFDFKAFFLDHGEKVAFGVFALITLLVLATSSWSRYSKSPEEIVQKVNKSRTDYVVNSKWTDDMKEGFTLQDFMQRTHEVQGPLSLSRYEYSTPLWHPLYRKQELAKEPEWLTVEFLDAKYGSFTLGILPKSAAGGSEMLAEGSSAMPAAGSGSAVGTAGKPGAVDDEFAPANRAVGPAGVAGSAGSAGAHGAGAPALSGTMASSAGAGHGGGAADAGMINPFGEGTMGVMGSEGMGGGASSMECRGERFIAVRGVFPLQQQLEKLQRALNLQSRSEARFYLEMRDFVLERQAAVAGSNPWTGPWQPVDIARAYEVLDEAFNYDFDTVLPEIVDPVITMPLPARIVGSWRDLATHPKIKNFELSGAEAEKARALEEKLIEQFDKMRLEEESRTKTRGGFARRSRNLQSMAATMYGSSENAMMFESAIRSDNAFNTTTRMSKEEIRAKLTSPADRVLLFRYFDFDVQPGFAYRYRVKLVLHNPNENKTPDQVVDQSVAQGEVRETPWSKESNVALVPESVNYFLRTVDRDTVNEPRAVKRPLANVAFFEWDAKKGTMIADTVQVFSLGQFIGEKKKSLHLDVAKSYFKDEDVEFRSDDILLDAEGDMKVALEDHKDLKLPSQKKGYIGMMAAAVVVDRSGEVVSLDPTPNTSSEKILKNLVERERAYYQDIKNKDDKAASTGEGVGMFGSSGSADMDAAAMLGIMKKSKAKKPALKPKTPGMRNE